MTILAVLSLVLLVVVSTQGQEDPDVHRDFEQIVSSKGYPIEKHQVLTQDGYQLGTFRIPHGRNGVPSKKTPVLLFHGLLDSAFTWIINMPSQSLPYILADQGYDVWMGNARGNRYSLSNINFPPTDDRFWNFTYDELAKYDLPTTIDYILNATKQTQLYYVGHSQGSAQMFAALSQNYNEISSKLRIFVALGPVTAPVHQTNAFIHLLVDVLPELDYLFKLVGVKDFLPPFSGILQEFFDLFCYEEPVACEDVIEMICGIHKAAFNDSRMDVMAAHEPGGTSVKNMVHWGQSIREKVFQMYDYGTEQNWKIYNQPVPPLYDIKKINSSVPIALFYGTLDELADPKDVEFIIQQLPKPPIYTKEIPTYSHLDFCWAIDANTQIYPEILTLFQKY